MFSQTPTDEEATSHVPVFCILRGMYPDVILGGYKTGDSIEEVVYGLFHKELYRQFEPPTLKSSEKKLYPAPCCSGFREDSSAFPWIISSSGPVDPTCGDSPTSD